MEETKQVTNGKTEGPFFLLIPQTWGNSFTPSTTECERGRERKRWKIFGILETAPLSRKATLVLLTARQSCALEFYGKVLLKLGGVAIA